MLNVGSIVSSAFALLARAPVAIGVWSALCALPGIGWWFIARREFSRLLEGSGFGAEYFIGMIGTQVALGLITVLIATAALRLSLRPNEPGVAGLRVGADELRILGVSLLLGLAFLVVALALGIVVAMVSLSSTGSGAGDLGNVVIAIPFILVALAIFVWLQVRLSLVLALTFVRRNIAIGEAWDQTRGRFWTLFGGYFVIFLFVVLLWSLSGLVTAAPYLSSFMEAGLEAEAMEGIAQGQMTRISVTTVASWALSGLTGTIAIVLFTCATAAVVRALGLEEEEISRTFA